MKRFWELDCLRGAAVIMMVIFHILFDLNYFGAYSVNLQTGFWLYFARATAAIFILLVGVSLTLSYNRGYRFFKYARRGFFIFSSGMLITAATWLFLGRGFVIFGVLHMIGLSIVLAYPFITRRAAALFTGIFAIISGFLIQGMILNTPYLLWLGFAPHGFYSVDYFPLLPWFGVVLLGIALGHALYPKGNRRINMPEVSGRPAGLIHFLGRHSLAIYLLHQPVIVLVLAAGNML